MLACSAAVAATEPPAPGDSGETVVVSGQKLPVENLLDRKVYTVTSDVQSAFGSVGDVLSVIPSVEVDPDGIVSLRGDNKVLILIDGKPSTQLSGSKAGDNLQSIPAKDIERIEVLTIPPPQFKAEGVAGVINIILRKKHSEGLTGSVQGSRGSGGRSLVGTSASYSSGPLTTSASASYRQDVRQRTTRSDVVAADSATGLPLNSINSIEERIRRDVPVVAVSAEYALNGRQSLSAAANWTDRRGVRTYTQLNDSSTSVGTLTSSTQRLSSGHDPQTALDEKLGFSQKLTRPGETLDFSLHRSTSLQHEHYDYTNDSFVPPSTPFYNNLSFREANTVTEFGTDYSLPVTKTRSLKLGYNLEQDDYKFGNTAANVDPSTSSETVDPSFTNDFKFRQRIYAGYASYQAGLGAWNWLLGLRAELTRTDAQQLTDNTSNTRSYFEIYPSLHTDFSLTDASTLSLGASRRITRPEFENLNPYVDREYTPNLQAGNPNLRPQLTQSYEAGYGYERRGLSYAVTAYYRRNRDSATDVTEYLEKGLTLATKTNLPENDSAGIELSANGHVFQKLAFSISGNLFHNQIDATALGIPGLQSTTGLNAKVKLDYRPTNDDSAQMTVTRSDKRLTPQGYVSAINIANLGYKRQLIPDLTAVLTVTDLFNGQRFRRFSSSPTFTQEYQRTTLGRVFYAGVIYSFGSTRKDSQSNFEYDPP